MVEQRTRKIGEHEYFFSQLGASQSLKLLVRITKIVGEPLGLLIGQFAAPKADKQAPREIKEDLIGLAMKSFMNALDENEVLDIIKTLTAGTNGNQNVQCDGKNINFDLHYDGRFDHLFEVLKAALEVQYGNFLSAILGKSGLKR